MNPKLRRTMAAFLLALAFSGLGARDLWSSANAAGTANAASTADASGTANATGTSLTASMILHRVATVYATARTYQDTGVVKPTGGTTIFLSDEPFSTAYRAPDRFRFEFVSMHPAMISPPDLPWIVYRNGTDVEQRAFSKVSAASSLDVAVARATGVSSSAAHTIPALLMPHIVSGRKLTDDAGARLLPEAPCDGHTCYRIEETHSRTGLSEIIWIDRTSFLVRRIDSHLPLPNHLTSDFSTLYHPAINKPVADSALKFGAPAEERPRPR